MLLHKKCVNSTFQLSCLESKSMISCPLCMRSWGLFFTVTACLRLWHALCESGKPISSAGTETSEAAVTWRCVVLFSCHVTHVVVCEQLIFLLIFLQDFLSITWTWQAILNLYFLNVYTLENPCALLIHIRWLKSEQSDWVFLVNTRACFTQRTEMIWALKMYLLTNWRFLHCEFIYRLIYQ